MKAKPRKKPARTKPVESPTHRLLRLIIRALDGKKAEDLQVLNVGAVSSITDYLVIATGTSEPHLRALRIELERVLDAERVHIVGVETEQGSGWTVVDGFEIMIHLLSTENRRKYQLESLWKDAQVVPVDELAREP